MARRVVVPAESVPARLDLRDALPDWYWFGGPGFEIWGGNVHRHVPREHWPEFDRRFMYRIDAHGQWAESRSAVGHDD